METATILIIFVASLKNYMSSMFRNLLDLVMEFLAGLGGL